MSESRIQLSPEETRRQRRALLAVAAGTGLFAGVAGSVVQAPGLLWPAALENGLNRWPTDIALSGVFVWLQYRLARVLLSRAGLRLRRMIDATDPESPRQAAWWFLAMAVLGVSQLIVRIASDRLFALPDPKFAPMIIFLFMAFSTALLADVKVNPADWREESDEPAGEEPQA